MNRRTLKVTFVKPHASLNMTQERQEEAIAAAADVLLDWLQLQDERDDGGSSKGWEASSDASFARDNSGLI